MERERERERERREKEREGHTALTLFFLAIFGTTLRVQLFLKELAISTRIIMLECS